MHILALLSNDALQALRCCVGPTDILVRVSGATALARIARPRGADAVVINPSAFTDAEWDEARAALSVADVPVLLYATLDPKSVRRVLAAAALGVREVLFRHIDDDPAAVRVRLEMLGHPAPPARLLSTLAGRIERLPADVQRATVPLFCSAPVPRWADQMAYDADVPRRSLDRWMSRAGLAGTAALLDVARLARIWTPLVEGKASHADVAARAGYRRARMLAVHARRIVGVSPSHFGTRLSADEFVSRLAHHASRG